jgi:SRSO17 transposase
MTRREKRTLDRELGKYMESMVEDMGRSERRSALEKYLTGLLLEGEGKSLEAMADRLVEDKAQAEAMRQRLQQCVTNAGWSNWEMRRRLALKLQEEMPGVEAMVVDDTGFAKKGSHSVGVGRQYSGTLGRTDNCQVAVSLHLAGEKGSGCIGMKLYLPEEWTQQAQRRKEVGIPEDLHFKTKGEIALELVDEALEWGMTRRVVLADAGYGDSREFREALTQRGLPYVVGVQGTHKVWPPGVVLVRERQATGRRGRPRIRVVAQGGQKPWNISELARELPEEEWHTVTWREGSRGKLTSRFAAGRVRSAERHTHSKPPGEEEGLLCEWPKKEPCPTKFWLSSLPMTLPRRTLVRLAKLRWRVERDYQDLKQEVGLDHFEGRTWRGFHHHATLCSVAHGFLALRRALFPPQQYAVDAA